MVVVHVLFHVVGVRATRRRPRTYTVRDGVIVGDEREVAHVRERRALGQRLDVVWDGEARAEDRDRTSGAAEVRREPEPESPELLVPRLELRPPQEVLDEDHLVERSHEGGEDGRFPSARRSSDKKQRQQPVHDYIEERDPRSITRRRDSRPPIRSFPPRSGRFRGKGWGWGP
jgi:hypothetical protein